MFSNTPVGMMPPNTPPLPFLTTINFLSIQPPHLVHIVDLKEGNSNRGSDYNVSRQHTHNNNQYGGIHQDTPDTSRVARKIFYRSIPRSRLGTSKRVSHQRKQKLSMYSKRIPNCAKHNSQIRKRKWKTKSTTTTGSRSMARHRQTNLGIPLSKH